MKTGKFTLLTIIVLAVFSASSCGKKESISAVISAKEVAPRDEAAGQSTTQGTLSDSILSEQSDTSGQINTSSSDAASSGENIDSEENTSSEDDILFEENTPSEDSPLSEELSVPEVSDSGYDPALSSILTGNWEDSYSQRAHMSIIETGSDGTYYCEIRWGSSWQETTAWRFYITPKSGETEYAFDTCMEVTCIAQEDGSEEESIQYRFGTGKLILTSDNTLLWVDDQDNAGENCIFVKS